MRLPGPRVFASMPTIATLYHLILLLVGDPCRDTTGWLRPDAAPDGTRPSARMLSTWLSRTPDLDVELMSPSAIAALNGRNAALVGAWRDPLGDDGPTARASALELADRLDHIGARIDKGEYVTFPTPPTGEPFELVRPRMMSSQFVTRAATIHGIVEPSALRCLPLETGFYRGKIDLAFDRNQCSRLDPGDLVRVERETSDGWLYVRAGHGVGWLHTPSLSPPLTAPEARALRDGPTLVVTGDLVPAETAHGDLILLRMGRRFPLVSSDSHFHQVRLPRLEGFIDAFISTSEPVETALLPLTRRHVLDLAFSRLDDPYGWGGLGGFRDCSALLLDLMSVFGLHLGRNSSVQGQAGERVVDLEGLSPEDKRGKIREAHAQGIVFLYMSGHIMLYLGEIESRDYAISAISEYLMPCPRGGHRTVRLDRVDVTDLERGAYTERTSFLDRITRLSQFGGVSR
jgi:hypothetical protein